MIYFIQAENGPIKIGYSRSLEKRLKSLQASNGQKLTVLGTMKGTLKDEKSLHEKFSDYKISSEWFRPYSDLLKFIKENSVKVEEAALHKETCVYLPKIEKIFPIVGENIKLARLRRKITSSMLAERVGITRMTLASVERGDPNTSLGIYARVLHSLGLEKDMENLASDDVFGRKLQDIALLNKSSK